MTMPTDQFSAVLSETDKAFMHSYNNGIVGRDIESILTEESMFNDYVTQLTQDFNEADREKIADLASNTRTEILTESSLGQIQPFASLTMPMLVKLWARLTMTQAIPTKPVNTPAFTVSFVKPCATC